MSTTNGSVLGASTVAGAISALPYTGSNQTISLFLLMTIITGLLVLLSSVIKQAYVKKLSKAL